MTVDMTEQERYEKLKDFHMTISAVANKQSIAETKRKYGTEIKNGVRLKTGDRKKLFRKIASEFGATGDYQNSDVQLRFRFSNENLEESLSKQRKNYYSFLKLLSCFGDVVDSAIGIEAHNRNEIGYKPDPSLNNMYVLMSAFRDGGLITPVKLEIKEFNDKANSLYVAIALESFPADKVTEKKSGIVTEGTTNNGVAQTIPPLTIKLADLFANVNPNDESFLKYVPKQFLSDRSAKNDEYVRNSSRTNPDSAIDRQVKETVTGSVAVVNAWAEAVSDAAVNYQL